MRKKSFKLTKETNPLLDAKIKGITEIIAKFAVQQSNTILLLLILIFLVGLIIYATITI